LTNRISVGHPGNPSERNQAFGRPARKNGPPYSPQDFSRHISPAQRPAGRPRVCTTGERYLCRTCQSPEKAVGHEIRQCRAA
jgi:hypothetical protein